MFLAWIDPYPSSAWWRPATAPLVARYDQESQSPSHHPL